MTTLLYKSIVIFLINLVMDVLAVWFTQAVTERKRILASIYSIVLLLMGVYFIREVVAEWVYIIPAALGCLVGTYFSVGKKQ